MSASPAGVVCTKHLIRCEGTVRYLAFSPRFPRSLRATRGYSSARRAAQGHRRQRQVRPVLCHQVDRRLGRAIRERQERRGAGDTQSQLAPDRHLLQEDQSAHHDHVRASLARSLSLSCYSLAAVIARDTSPVSRSFSRPSRRSVSTCTTRTPLARTSSCTCISVVIESSPLTPRERN